MQKRNLKKKSILGLKRSELIELDRTLKQQAIAFTQGWVDAVMKAFEEPVRVGVKKGDAIGFTREKMKASLFSMLHPTVSLKEIAGLSDCSYGMLLVWRTEAKFREKLETNIQFLGKAISNTIEFAIDEVEISFLKKKGGIHFGEFFGMPRVEVLRSERKNKDSLIKDLASKSGKDVEVIEIDDMAEKGRLKSKSDLFKNDLQFAMFLLDLLPYFDPGLSKPFIGMAMAKIEGGVFDYAVHLLRLRSSVQIRMRVNPGPVLRETLRHTLMVGIDLLTDPEVRKSIGDEGLKNLRTLFQRIVSDLFDKPSKKEGEN